MEFAWFSDCFFRQQNLQFALADYHQALELDARDEATRNRVAVVHNEYGILDFQDKAYEEAESRFTLALQHNPKVAQYYISRSRARMMQEVLSMYETVVLLVPKSGYLFIMILLHILRIIC